MEHQNSNPFTYQEHLVTNPDIKDYKEKNFYTQKYKRTFHGAMSGMTIAEHGNKTVRFMTLTTSDLCSQQIDYDSEKGINEHFQILKKRLLLYTPNQLVTEGYMTKRQRDNKYNPHEYNTPFRMDYLKTTTNEGNGVIHTLYRGSYLPQSLLSNLWMDIHLSWDVNIKKIRTNPESIRKSASYICQYVSDQKCTYTRTSASWNWVTRGYRKIWKELNQICMNECYYNPVQRKYFKKRKLTNPFKTALQRWQWHLKRIALQKYATELIGAINPAKPILSRWSRI